MTSAMIIDGKSYLSSKEAAVQTGYTQDYIGQLARAGSIDAKRIGGLWYIFLDSLTSYKKQADSYVPTPPTRVSPQDVDSFVSFDGKDYISAARAAEITGYAQDYVGQLAREGTVLARQVGSRWYVSREDLVKHKEEKDSLLGAVQAAAVGLSRPNKPIKVVEEVPVEATTSHFNYSDDKNDLMPSMNLNSKQVEEGSEVRKGDVSQAPLESESGAAHSEVIKSIPIRVVEEQVYEKKEKSLNTYDTTRSYVPKSVEKAPTTRKRSYSMAVSAVVIVLVVVSAGYLALKPGSGPIAGANTESVANEGLLASAPKGAQGFLGFIENILAPEIFYKRQK